MSVLDAKANTTIAFTDGACKGNPGAGGWGSYLVFADGQTQAWCGGDKATTNNRMELMGAIYALKNSPIDTPLEIWTDSSYVKNGITQWIDGWKKKGWKTASKKPVANQDLWQQLDKLRQSRPVSWHWVKGHAGHEGNEKADELANLGVERVLEGHAEPFLSESSAALDNSHPELSPEETALKKNTSMTESEVGSTSSPADNQSSIPDDDWLDNDPLGLGFSEDLTDGDADSESYYYNDTPTSDSRDDTATVNELSAPYSAIEVNNSVKHHDDSASALSPPSPSSPSIAQPKNSSTTPQINSDFMTSNTAAPAVNSTEVPTMGEQTSSSELSQKPSFDGDTSRANPHFVPLLPEPIHRGSNARQLIMDTETTGLDAMKGDRIIEVGIVEMIGRKFTGEKLHVYINPERGMDEDAIRIHGISEAFLKDKPKFAEVAQQLFDFMAGAEVIAHNAPFDMGFLTMEFDRVGLKGFADTVQVTDSLVMAKQQYPGQRNTLDALVKRLNVGKQDRTFHGALLDAEILAEVYLAMTGGQVALAIDEETHSEGGGTHARFDHLATKLVASPQDSAAHQAWLTSLTKEYPALKDVWGA